MPTTILSIQPRLIMPINDKEADFSGCLVICAKMSAPKRLRIGRKNSTRHEINYLQEHLSDIFERGVIAEFFDQFSVRLGNVAQMRHVNYKLAVFFNNAAEPVPVKLMSRVSSILRNIKIKKMRNFEKLKISQVNSNTVWIIQRKGQKK
jgi:hypothetical protein